MLEIAPDPLIGVELGSVRGEILQREPTAVVVDEPPDRGGLVGVDIVPDEDDPAVDMMEQVPEEYEYLRGGNRAAADQDVELPLRADARDGRELGPGIAVGDDGGLSPGSPGPNARRNLRLRRSLVGEDQRGSLPFGFFLCAAIPGGASVAPPLRPSPWPVRSASGTTTHIAAGASGRDGRESAHQSAPRPAA